MPGIFGIVHDDEAARRDVPQRMQVVMQHHDWYGRRLHESPSFGGGVVALSQGAADAAVYRSPAGNTIFLDGEIDDLPALRRDAAAGGEPLDDDSPAAVLLSGFERFGQPFLQRVSGYFAAAVLDSSSRTLTLVTDRFGMKPLYYAAAGDGFVFASEVKALLQFKQVATRHSIRGLAQFFTFGHLLGDDTLYDAITYAGAASCIAFDASARRLTRTTYWHFQPGPPLEGANEALEALEGSFRRAVERRLQGPKRVGLSLSGGLDARTILAAVPPGVSLRSVSLGIQGSIDHRVASELAALAGADHHTHYLDAGFLDRFPEHLQTLAWLTDGHYLDQAITVPTLPVYRELGIEALLRGHAGELLHMDKAYAFSINPSALGFPNHGAVESWLWQHLTDYMIGGVGHAMFKASLRIEASDVARDSLRRALTAASEVQPPAQALWHLFVTERLRRETAMSMQMFTSVVDVRLPYLDNDFVDLILRIPPAMKIGDGIQSYILERTRPAFLRITNANTGTRMGASRMARELSSLRLRVFAKLRVPGYQPYERLGLWLSEELQPLVRELVLGERTLDRGIFDPDVLGRIVDDHRRRVRNHTFLLMALMIYESGQRQLVDGDGRVKPVGSALAGGLASTA